jgi:hypothetical protein
LAWMSGRSDSLSQASAATATRKPPVTGSKDIPNKPPVSRDYELSLRSIDQLIAQGYAVAMKTLERRAKTG